MSDKIARRGGLNLSSLSTYRNAIYGLSAIWIVFYHGAELGKVEFGESTQMIGQVLCMGNCAVDIFMLLSGIGLYFSLSKKPKILSFYWRRIIRIYLPYLLLAVPYIIYMCLIVEQQFGLFVKASLAINYWTGDDEPIVLWYVSAIIIFYLLSPLIFKFIHYKEKGSLLRTIALSLVVIATTFILFYFAKDVYYSLDKVLPRFNVFILGLYLGKLVKEKRSFSPLFLMVCVLIFALGVPLYGIPTLHGVYYRYYGSLTGVALTFVMAQAFVSLSGIKLDKFFNFFGAFSLEIYIATSIGRRVFAKTPYYDGHVYRNYLLFITIFMVAAYLASLIQKLILRDKKSTAPPKL